jgi:ABC-type antimicrobial peptide transport system permease subunit
MALGARPGDVFKNVVGNALMLALIGVALGVAGALGVTRVMSTLLYGVSATDPLTFVAVSVLLTGVALAASFVPARRATKVDPIEALRYE